MASDLQQIASRTNGAKSHGPTTAEGKQTSALNSLNHGFNSKRVVIPGESQHEFDELLISYLEEHQPETPTERSLIENMAIARWRQQRAWTLETAGLANQIARPRYMEGEDPDTQAFIAFRTLADDSRTLDLLNRYEARFERQFRVTLTAFLTLRAKRRANEKTEIAEQAEAVPGAPKERRRLKFYWVDDEGNATLQADTYLDPDPISGSFRVPDSELANPPVTDISDYRRDPVT